MESDLLRERVVWSELCVRVVGYTDDSECFVYSELRVCVAHTKHIYCNAHHSEADISSYKM